MALHRLIVVTVLLLTVAGCTAAPAPPPGTDPTSEPTPSAAPSPTVSPSAEPVDAPECAELLDAETTQRFADFAADGWQEIPDFAERISEQPTPLAEFVRSGGVACQWGYPASDGAAILAWAPLSGATATTLQAEIEGEGFTNEPGAEGVTLCSPVDSEASVTTGCYLFTSIEAFYADPRESLPMLVAQVAAR